MRRTAVVALLLIAMPVLAEGWTAAEAEAAFRELVTRKVTPSQQSARNAEVELWVASVEKLDLGEYGYLRSIALYFRRDYDGAAKGLLDWAESHDAFAEPYRMFVGRILMAKAAKAARDGSLHEAAFDLALTNYPDRPMVYRLIGANLLWSEAEGAKESLVRVTRLLLADDDIPDDVKLATLKKVHAPSNMPLPSAAADEKLPPVEGPDVEGKTVSLADYRGKVLLIDFWATWCPPCVKEMPYVVKAWETFHEKGFDVLGISLDQPKSAQKVRDFMVKHGMKWRTIYEGKGWDSAIAKVNGVEGIPATILLDREGKVRFRGLRGAELGRRVAELMAEPARVRKTD